MPAYADFDLGAAALDSIRAGVGVTAVPGSQTRVPAWSRTRGLYSQEDKNMLALTIGGKTEYLPQIEADAAMKRYWEAKSGGDTTAALIRVDGRSDDPPPTPPTALGTTSSTALEATDRRQYLPNDLFTRPEVLPGQVSEAAVARIEQQEQWLLDNGFAVPAPLFAPGTRVTAVGDDNFRLERSRVEEMPRFDEVAHNIIERVKAEDRQDHRADIRSLTLSPRGTLFVGNDEEYAIESSAFSQLAMLSGFGAGTRYLRDLCDMELRSANVNWQLVHRPNRPIVLRTRLGSSGRRQIFAAVSPSYAAVDTDEVLETIKPALSDARTELIYDGEGLRGNALWMPDTVSDLAAGDVFKVGVRLHTNDIGKGRISISAVVFRNLCLNLIIIGESSQATVSQVHRGDTRRIIANLEEGVDKARAKVADFLEAWGHARTVNAEPADTFRDWIESKRIVVKGERDKDHLVQVFLSSWAKEPGRTLADAVNAVTRAAHEHPVWTLPIRESLEQQAAELVYVR